MKTSDFNSSLRFCENEAELRLHHANHLFDALNLLAQKANEGTVELGELIAAIKKARYVFENTKRKELADKEAEVTAHGNADLAWLD